MTFTLTAVVHKEILHNYDLRLSKIFRLKPTGKRWVLQKNCRWQITQMNHDGLGHFANEKTINRMRQQYWLPKMKQFVGKYIKYCLNCQYNKTLGKKKPELFFSISKCACPYANLHLDHVGSLV
jgi:hypothetical protein